jgi:hypothetical protein
LILLNCCQSPFPLLKFLKWIYSDLKTQFSQLLTKFCWTSLLRLNFFHPKNENNKEKRSLLSLKKCQKFNSIFWLVLWSIDTDTLPLVKKLLEKIRKMKMILWEFSLHCWGHSPNQNQLFVIVIFSETLNCCSSNAWNT